MSCSEPPQDDLDIVKLNREQYGQEQDVLQLLPASIS